MKKLFIFICSLTVILSSLLVPVSAQNYASSIEQLNCKVDLLVSLDNGSVIVNKNANQKVAPASLTKIMTALVVLKNSPDLKKEVTVSQEGLATLYGTGSSVAGLKPDEKISIYNLLCCLLIPSGNDAAVTLAYEIGGSIENFVKMMNAEAKELGCKNTHFDNPHGLDSATHYTTASDLVKMAKAALEYSEFETIISNPTYTLPATNMNPERNLTNTNFLLNRAYRSYFYPYCKGIKTGSTDNAGKCLVSYASKDGYNYIAVAMGGTYMDSDKDKIEENQAFMDTIRMYDWAFKNLSYEVVAKKNQYISTAPLKYCWSTDSARLVAEKDALALVPKGNNSDSVSYEPVDPPESLSAPLKAGDKVCKAKIMYADQQIGTVDLVVAEDANMSIILYAKDLFQRMTGHTIFKIIIILIVLLVGLYVFAYIKANHRNKKRNELKIVKYNQLERNTAKTKGKKKK